MEFFSIEWDKKIQDNATLLSSQQKQVNQTYPQKKPQIKGPSDLSGEIIQGRVVLFFNFRLRNTPNPSMHNRHPHNLK